MLPITITMLILSSLFVQQQQIIHSALPFTFITDKSMRNMMDDFVACHQSAKCQQIMVECWDIEINESNGTFTCLKPDIAGME